MMSNCANPLTHDVIISGAGPVGLLLACELALRKCSVLILEAAENPQSPLKRLPFGLRGLSAPSVEALHRRGLLEELEVPKRLKDPHSNAVSGPRRQAGHFAGIPFHSGDIDTAQWRYRLPSSCAVSSICEIQELETVLGRRAETLGVRIKRGFPVTAFVQSADGVTVAAGQCAFRGRWLVGCDGSRSAVRKLGNFKFAGTEPQFTGYSAHVDLVDPQKLNAGRTLTARGMYLQSQPGFLAIQDFDGGAFHDAGGPITRERVQEVLRRISDTDVTIGTLHVATTWTDRARQVTAYRDARALLAGDAAHIHSPLGGQGLNLGLGDAMNLGWKLAETIRRKAPEGLLDSYQTERHPLGARVLDWSRAQVLVMRPDPDARALHAIFQDLMETRDGATYFAGRVWGVATRYALGDGHPLVGHSVPNFEFDDGTTIGELMCEGQGILLDFNDCAWLKTLASEFGECIRLVAAAAKEQLGLSTLLIRPDGFVAWACSEEPDEPSIRMAVARWFGSCAAGRAA